MRPAILDSLFAPVSSLTGIGPKLEKTLTRLFRGNENAATARLADLLFHVPTGIIDRRQQPTIQEAPSGQIVTLKVWVDKHNPAPRGNRRIPYRVTVHDETGFMTLVFFHARSEWLEKQLPVGEMRYISGKMEWFNDQPSMVHPDHMVSEEEFSELPLVEPIYGLTAGLSGKVLARSIRSAVDACPDLPEWADAALIKREKWPPMREALETIHHPRDMADLDPRSPARCRLAHDEYLAGQMALGLLRNRMKLENGIARQGTKKLTAALLRDLPYSLTGAQIRSMKEIAEDLGKPERMLRLLQGDVGAGKTVVALLAMAIAIESGAQAAIMAPTGILAQQHLASIGPICAKNGIVVELLTGKDTAAKKRETYERLANGEIDILIGTHALFQEKVVFKNLGLAVIDEQHRFGVHQRLALSDKGQAVDVLVMTATPIPRTLVLTYFGDMDVSKLDEKPPGRQPIVTTAMPLERLDELIARAGKAMDEGQKLYWICPLVEESDIVSATAAEDRYKRLQSIYGDRIGLIHGRMTNDEKNLAMEAFQSGRTRLLVATTVIEVGVDVPDATNIVIEHAERFGLAQLHQLRGRVGRGDKASSCILLYKSPLGEVAHARLKIMRESEDGFLLAEEDLRLRGEGEILGTRQSGTPGFNLVSAEHHGSILEIARDEARLNVTQNPKLEGEQGEALRILLYLFGQDQAIKLLQAG